MIWNIHVQTKRRYCIHDELIEWLIGVLRRFRQQWSYYARQNPAAGTFLLFCIDDEALRDMILTSLKAEVDATYKQIFVIPDPGEGTILNSF